MTPREQKCLRFVERYIVEHDGVVPTLAEIADELGLATRSGAHAVVDALCAEGLMRRSRNWRSRSLEIVGLPPALIVMSDEALLAECARRGLLKVAA